MKKMQRYWIENRHVCESEDVIALESELERVKADNGRLKKLVEELEKWKGNILDHYDLLPNDIKDLLGDCQLGEILEDELQEIFKGVDED